MSAKHRFVAITLLCCAFFASVARAQEPEASQSVAEPAAEPDPMAAFARLVGGEWHIGPLRHVFEWGVGRRTVHARSYDEAGELASELRWFFHPGEKAIRGYSVDASGAFFAEMTTRFEGDTLINELRMIGADGAEQSYSAKWVFTDDDHYDWTLWAETPEGPKQTMAATAERRAVGKGVG